ncbi:hypothetical protein K2227_22180 (plasmid) [Shewanella putrefaciens]|nr:hypothetical protein K2227_22180 [Shewanella putrefaciens]
MIKITMKLGRFKSLKKLVLILSSLLALQACETGTERFAARVVEYENNASRYHLMPYINLAKPQIDGERLVIPFLLTTSMIFTRPSCRTGECVWYMELAGERIYSDASEIRFNKDNFPFIPEISAPQLAELRDENYMPYGNICVVSTALDKCIDKRQFRLKNAFDDAGIKWLETPGAQRRIMLDLAGLDPDLLQTPSSYIEISFPTLINYLRVPKVGAVPEDRQTDLLAVQKDATDFIKLDVQSKKKQAAYQVRVGGSGGGAISYGTPNFIKIPPNKTLYHLLTVHLNVKIDSDGSRKYALVNPNEDRDFKQIMAQRETLARERQAKAHAALLNQHPGEDEAIKLITLFTDKNQLMVAQNKLCVSATERLGGATAQARAGVGNIDYVKEAASSLERAVSDLQDSIYDIDTVLAKQKNLLNKMQSQANWVSLDSRIKLNEIAENIRGRASRAPNRCFEPAAEAFSEADISINNDRDHRERQNRANRDRMLALLSSGDATLNMLKQQQQMIQQTQELQRQQRMANASKRAEAAQVRTQSPSSPTKSAAVATSLAKPSSNSNEIKAQSTSDTASVNKESPKTKSMADYLEAIAYCVEFKSGGWKCDGPIQKESAKSDSLNESLGYVGCTSPRTHTNFIASGGAEKTQGAVYYCGYGLWRHERDISKFMSIPSNILNQRQSYQCEESEIHRCPRP